MTTKATATNARGGPAQPFAIWSLTVMLGLGTVLIWLLDGTRLRSLPSPVHLVWPLLVAGFALGHLASVDLRFRESSHHLDLTDVVLLPALVFSGGIAVVAAAAIGTLVLSFWSPRQPIKVAFNVALHALAVSLAFVCFRAVLGDASILSPLGWLASFCAVLVASVVTVLFIQIVIALATRSFALDGMRNVAVALVLAVTINATLGLAAVHMLWASMGGGILFVAVGVAVAYAYAVHGRLQVRHTTLNQLYHFEQALAGIVESDQVIAAVLAEALALFNCEVAQLVLPNDRHNDCYTLRAGELIPVITRGTHPFVELLGAGQAVVVAPRATDDHNLATALAACGLRDALALRLPSDVAGSVEILCVADRIGVDGATFGADDVRLAEALAMPAAMALRSSELLNQLRDEVAIKEHQATHDSLTGLPNRTLFAKKLDDALETRRPNTFVGVMLLDLDGFKSVNDSLGHESRDALLQHIAARASDLIGDRGVVGRLGGDEFALFVEKERDAAEIAAIAQALDIAVRAPVTIAGISVDVRSSIGVSIAPVHGEDRKTLLRYADFAMYRAKQSGGGVAVHNDIQDGKIDRPSLVAALREAIYTQSLNLHYQPKLSLDDSRVIGVEALLRWTHPVYGPINPDQVIPVAESAGLIGPLTRWVLTAALAQCRAWHLEGLDLNVAVNLSPSQIDDPEIVTQVCELLEAYELPPQALTLEITESVELAGKAFDDTEVLETLASLGVRLSIDDFGVGTSSLTRIRRFPVKEVKIDKSFVMNMNIDPKDYAVVASTVELAHELGLQVVAEGVEVESIAEKLKTLGCDIVQGYLYSAPLHADDLAHWVRMRGPVLVPSPTTIIPFRAPTVRPVRPLEPQRLALSDT